MGASREARTTQKGLNPHPPLPHPPDRGGENMQRLWTTKRKTIAPVFLALLMVLAGLAVPSAAAHACAHHDPKACDAGNCPKGEDHHHIDYNDDQEDYECRSTAADKSPDSCSYYGIEHPPRVCRLLEGNQTEHLQRVTGGGV